MNDDARYAALKARDGRFDGRFFTGVTSTGVYCRPICPSRLPKRTNVRFFQSRAAAEAAGFRACKRCRPDTAPGSPAWSGTHATVRRALRLIHEGALDRQSVSELAARLGLSARQLRRLFMEHAGASPARFARTRRAHFARNLLEGSTLPMTQVASASGFGSLRAFNDAIRASFDATPTELRSQKRDSASGIVLRLPIVEPYDFLGVLAFFASRPLDGLEALSGESYSRTFSIDGHRGTARVTRSGSHLAVRLDASLGPVALAVLSRLRFMFDVDADPEEIGRHLRRDPLLRPLLRARPGLRVPAYETPFEAAVRAVVGQQISVAAARTILSRIVARYGEACDEGRAFPTPDALADGVDVAGLTQARRNTLRAVVRFFLRDSEPDLDAFAAIRGVGPWTVANVALRGLRDPDAFPLEDLVLRRAMGDGPSRVRAVRAETWRPYRAYGACHLWRAQKDPR